MIDAGRNLHSLDICNHVGKRKHREKFWPANMGDVVCARSLIVKLLEG